MFLIKPRWFLNICSIEESFYVIYCFYIKYDKFRIKIYLSKKMIYLSSNNWTPRLCFNPFLREIFCRTIVIKGVERRS